MPKSNLCQKTYTENWEILWKRSSLNWVWRKIFFDGFDCLNFEWKNKEIHLNFLNWKTRQIDWRKTYWFGKEKTRETDARPICIKSFKSSKWTKPGIMWRQKRKCSDFLVSLFSTDKCSWKSQCKYWNLTPPNRWDYYIVSKVSFFAPFF